jgi:hypothetical protein
MTRRNWKFVAFAIGVVLIPIVLAAVSYALMLLWNWLIPAVIGWKAIDFWQAMGLLVLSRLLFGFRGGWGHRGGWRGRMRERWDSMTPEERAKFREGMMAKCGWKAPGEGPSSVSAP